MLIASLPLLLASIAITVKAAIGVFDYNKRPEDLLAVNIPYSTTAEVRALVQMGSVETWFALSTCNSQTCLAIEPVYSATPISPCTLAAHYQCAVVGRGKPFVQSIIASTTVPTDVINQAILAVDYLNSNFPDTSSVFAPAPAATGVAGLGPICSRSCLVRKFDAEDVSASILQNLFRFRYAPPGKQEFFFQRTVGLYGSSLNQDDVFYQAQSAAADDQLIPIIRGACAWTFRISSAIEIESKNKPLIVRRPATITYDPTYDFNIVSQEMAQAYAEAFNSLNNYSAGEVDLGDVRVFRYWQNTLPSPNPIFPGIAFSAIAADDNELNLTFDGLQGAYLPDPDFEYYLPFAYRKAAPCCRNWILGYPAINNGVTTAGTNYDYPKLVVHGSATGIENYYIQLTA